MGIPNDEQRVRGRSSAHGPLDRLRYIPQHQRSPVLTGDPSSSEQDSERLCVSMGVTGVLAAGVGLIDFVAIPKARTHRVGWEHFLGNVAALLVALLNGVIRVDDPAAAVTPWGITLSAVPSLSLP